MDPATRWRIAVEALRTRVAAVLNLVDDAAAGRVEFPTGEAAVRRSLDELVEYILAAEEGLTHAHLLSERHVALVAEVEGVHARLAAAQAERRALLSRLTASMASRDAQLAAMHADFTSLKASMGAVVDGGTGGDAWDVDNAAAALAHVTAAAERFGYTSPPGSATLPSHPTPHDIMHSRLFQLQTVVAAATGGAAPVNDQDPTAAWLADGVPRLVGDAWLDGAAWLKAEGASASPACASTTPVSGIGPPDEGMGKSTAEGGIHLPTPPAYRHLLSQSGGGGDGADGLGLFAPITPVPPLPRGETPVGGGGGVALVPTPAGAEGVGGLTAEAAASSGAAKAVLAKAVGRDGGPGGGASEASALLAQVPKQVRMSMMRQVREAMAAGVPPPDLRAMVKEYLATAGHDTTTRR